MILRINDREKIHGTTVDDILLKIHFSYIISLLNIKYPYTGKNTLEIAYLRFDEQMKMIDAIGINKIQWLEHVIAIPHEIHTFPITAHYKKVLAEERSLHRQMVIKKLLSE